MKAAAACRDTEQRPRPPNFSPSCAWHYAPLGTSIAVHSVEPRWTSSSKDLRASGARLGGVTLAMWTILQKLPRMCNKVTATWISTAATSTSLDSDFLDSAHLPAIDLEQSPIGAPRISKLGRSEHLTSDGNEVFPFLLNHSHLAKFTWKPRAGPISSIKCKDSTDGWLPARTPSSRYQA